MRLTSRILSSELGWPVEETDWTPRTARETELYGETEDLLVLGVSRIRWKGAAPAGGAAVPSEGRGTPAVLEAVYGNRAFEDALLEGRDILAGAGFVPIAAGAFIGEHSYSRQVAAGRPDEADLSAVREFSRQIAEKLRRGSRAEVKVPGTRPYRELSPANPARPQTTDACIRCLACVRACPKGLIHCEDPARVDPGCLHCCACIKACPIGAKAFDDERIRQTTRMLESRCCTRREPEWFL